MSKYTVKALKPLKLYNGPDANSGVLATVSAGSKVLILRIMDGWLLLQERGREDARGYVSWKSVLLDTEGQIPTLDAPPSPEEAPLAPPRRQMIATAHNDVEKQVAGVWNSLGGLLSALAYKHGIDPAVMAAVLVIESGGRAFRQRGQMVIRFENHLFYQHWGSHHQAQFEDYFQFDPTKQWRGHLWRTKPDADWQRFHGDQTLEWQVFEYGSGIDPSAAKRSISMGAPQIPGSSFSQVGYEDEHEMFAAFNDYRNGVRNQVVGMFKFIENDHLNRGIPALRNQDFLAFAEMYNGPSQAEPYAGWISDRLAVLKRLRTGRL